MRPYVTAFALTPEFPRDPSYYLCIMVICFSFMKSNSSHSLLFVIGLNKEIRPVLPKEAH